MDRPSGTGTPPPPDDPTLTFNRPRAGGFRAPPPSYDPPLDPMGDIGRVVGGLALLVIPVAALVLAYVLPTFRTIQLSRIEHFGVLGTSNEVGTANYAELFADGTFAGGLAQLAGPIAVTVLIGSILAPLLAWLLHRSGARVRALSRIVWSLAAITFVPTALTVAWLVDRVVSESDREASVYDWIGLTAGVVLGIGVLVGLAVLRGGAETGTARSGVLTVAGLSAITLAATGIQSFTYGSVSGLPPEAPTPVAQIRDELVGRVSAGAAAATSVLLLAILAVLGLGAGFLFLASRTRIDVTRGPADPAPARPAAAFLGLAVLVIVLAAVGYFLLPWLTRLGEGGVEEEGLWFLIRRTWGPPLVTTAVALPVAAIGGFAIGALRPFGDASRWLLLLFAPWVFVGSGPLGVANLEAIAEEGEWMVIGSFPVRAWIAIPLLFLFAALFWGLEDRRRTALREGTDPGEARRAFFAGAWPMLVLAALVLLLVHAQDQFWQQITWQDMFASGPMTWALENREFEDTGVGLGFPLPILAAYAVAAVAFAIWYLPKVAVKVGRD